MSVLTTADIETFLLFDRDNWSIGKAGIWPHPDHLVADFALDTLPANAGNDLVRLLRVKYGIAATVHEMSNPTLGDYRLALRVAQTPTVNEVAMLEAAFRLTASEAWIANEIVRRDGRRIEAWNLPLTEFDTHHLLFLTLRLQQWIIPYEIIKSQSLARIILGDNDGVAPVLRVRGNTAINALRVALPSLRATRNLSPPHRQPVEAATPA